jgi:hypothetical protein
VLYLDLANATLEKQSAQFGASYAVRENDRTAPNVREPARIVEAKDEVLNSQRSVRTTKDDVIDEANISVDSSSSPKHVF